jgi:phage gp29-like protein
MSTGVSPSIDPASQPANFLKGLENKARLNYHDPALDVPGMPPNFGEDVIPHVISFQGLMSSISKVYRPSDQALLASRENARYMRNDLAIMECLEHRQRSVCLLDWHLVPEDEKDQRQQQLCDDLTRILERTKRFHQLRESLQEALWYGKYGVSMRYRWKWIGGKKCVAIDRWRPVHGDKLVFRLDDGSGDYDPDQIGIRVGPTWMMNKNLDPNRVQPTDCGMAYFLEGYERKLMAVHTHRIEDGEYEDVWSAGRIHGVGIRHRIYWTWYQAREALAWLMEFLERSAFGLEIWYYPWGSAKAEKEMRTAAEERIGGGRNVILVPRPLNATSQAYGVEKLETGMAGAETLKTIITDLFGHQIKRYILGQTLTTEAASTGLGSNLASIHLDTYLQIVRYDAKNLDETITTDIVDPLKEKNFPWARNVHVQFVTQTESPDVESKLNAWRQAYEMGCKLKETDVMAMIGATAPEASDEVLVNPMVEQAKQQLQQAQQQQAQAEAQQQRQVAQEKAATRAQVRGTGPLLTVDELQQKLTAVQMEEILRNRGLMLPETPQAAQLPQQQPQPQAAASGQEGEPQFAVTPNPFPENSERVKVRTYEAESGAKVERQQFLKGVLVELEHGDDIAQAARIAADHLRENPDYYLMVDLGATGKRERIEQYALPGQPQRDINSGIDSGRQADAPKAPAPPPMAPPAPPSTPEPRPKGPGPVDALKGLGKTVASVAGTKSQKRPETPEPSERRLYSAEHSVGEIKSVAGRTYELNANHRWKRLRRDGEQPSMPKLSGNELGQSKAEIRKGAFAYWQQNLRRPLPNEETAIHITVSRQGIDELISHSGDIRRLQLLPALPEMLRQAAYLHDAPDHNTAAPRFDRWLYFHAEAELAGRPTELVLVVGEKKNERAGASLYTIEDIQEIRKPGPKEAAEPGSAAPRTPGLSTGSIGRSGEKLNPPKEGDGPSVRYSREDPELVERFARQYRPERYQKVDWDEDRHPREADGKFAEKDGGQTTAEEQAAYEDYREFVKGHLEPRPIEAWLPQYRAAQQRIRGEQSSASPISDPQSPEENATLETPSTAPEIPSETPREQAARQTKRDTDEQYAFARKSKVSNVGQDLLGSARHKANAWKGLDDAEREGTAAELVTREMLLKNEPHKLMLHVAHNPLTALAMHQALRVFPAKPGYAKRRGSPSEEEQKKNRQACHRLDDKVSELIRKYRGQKGAEYMDQVTASDRFNDTANSLVGLHKALQGVRSRFGTKAIKNRLEDFSRAFKDKYGLEEEDWSPDTLNETMGQHAGDVIEGRSLNETFGTKGESRKRFDTAQAYVKKAVREGKDLGIHDQRSAKMTLVEKMQLRGLQFGNYVTDEEREHHLLKSAEALTDLSDVLGVPAEYVSWKGRLGIAYGARGKGNATAHYEPGSVVINLTRASGAGSLAHEWGHFFDHALAGFAVSGDMDGHSSGDYESERTSAKRFAKDPRGPHGVELDEKGRVKTIDRSSEPLFQAYDGLRQSWRESGFHDRLRGVLQKAVNDGLISEDKANNYWRTGREVFARSFERFVQRKLEKRGQKNTYLAGLAPNASGSEGIGLWPNDAETDAMAPHFEKILESFRDGVQKGRYSLRYSEGRAVLRFERSGLVEQFNRAFAGVGLIRYQSELTHAELQDAREATDTDASYAQKNAGNYAKGRVEWKDLEIVLENPKGSIRTGINKAGEPWAIEMKHDYGYFAGIKGKDKDELDVFVGPHLESELVFVVNQVDPESRKFDEHKVVVGCLSAEESRELYEDNYTAGWDGFESIVPMTLEQFKRWTEGGKVTKPAKDA